MKRKLLALAAAASMAIFSTGAHAATLSGDFVVTVCNVNDVNRTESQATVANYLNCLNNTLGGVGSDSVTDVLTYVGAIDFGTTDGSDATTIADWFATGGGAVARLDIGGLQLSKPDIDGPNGGTATTTFIFFELLAPAVGPTFDVDHDDGFAIFENNITNRLGGNLGPTSLQNTTVTGYQGGPLAILYVATNGDPSILRVSEVPLPAAAWMMLAGLGGLAAVKRRKTA